MPEFAFDLRLRTVARVKNAATVQEAVAKLAALGSFNLETGASDVLLTQATAEASEAECFEIDGRNIRDTFPTCRYCFESLRLIGGVWRDEGDEHPEICGGRNTPGSPHALE